VEAVGDAVAVKSVRGKRIGRFYLIEHLASGGMADVYLARLQGEGGFEKEVALKILQGRLADDALMLEMFLEEARLGAELRHPSIVDVYEIGREDDLPFIAMEYIEGRTLTELVTRAFEVSHPLPLSHAIHIVAQVAEGLAYLHEDALPGRPGEPGIVHRDISPTNVMIGSAGQTKIIDFGIAQRGRPDPRTAAAGLRPGKVSYMSPEQVRGKPLDGRSDIFSLGIILYEITLGKRLWRGPPEVVMRRIVEDTIPPPTYVDPRYPPALERIVLRTLEKHPEDRYSSAAELALDLGRLSYLEGEGGDRVTSRHLAEYFRRIHAPAARVSEGGAKAARAFLEDETAGPEIDEPLDFDRAGGTLGARLAKAMHRVEPIELAMQVLEPGRSAPAAHPAHPASAGVAMDARKTPSAAAPAFSANGPPDTMRDIDMVPAREPRGLWVLGLLIFLALVAGGVMYVIGGY